MLLLMMAMCMVFACLPTAQAGGVSKAEMYAALQDELRLYLDGDTSMSLADLTAQFEGLGAYKKSAAFSYYTAILRDTEDSNYAELSLRATLMRLDEDFCKLLVEEGYPTVDEVEAYALGRQAEEAKEYSAAIVYYEKSIVVLDSMIRLARLSMVVPPATPTPALPAPEFSGVQVVTHSDTRREVKFSATREWSAKAVDSWLTLNKTGGSAGANSITVTLDENPSTTNARTGRVLLQSADLQWYVEITQDAKGYLEVSSSGSGNTRTIWVNAGGNWYATSDSWITLYKSQGGSGSTSFTAELNANPSSTSSRTGRIKVTCGSMQREITITQDPNPALYDKNSFWVGATVEFGHYEQDGWSGNGQEPIEWKVLTKSGNYAMLLSVYALDSAAYHGNGYSEHVTWSNCSLRSWLNNTFYWNAFSSKEQGAIRTTTVSTPYTQGYDTYPGPSTQDKVYLLSYEEVQDYQVTRLVYPTQYATNQGVMVRYDNGGTTYWWLRSPHVYGKVSVINSIGNLYGSKTYDADGGVRPVIWVDLSNPIFN